MVGKRYAVSDLHGQYDLYLQIKEYINESDIVYALGDFGDRGPQPWRTLQAGLDDPQFVYLMGNHDHMLLRAIEEYNRAMDNYGFCDVWRHMYVPNGSIALLDWNGGIDTLNDWSILEEDERDYYYNKLKRLPLEIRLAAEDVKHMIYLTHAGFTPGTLENEDVEKFVWDRLHFYDEWQGNGNLIIHGHTPCSHLKGELSADSYDISKGYLSYCGGSKICIDLGAHMTGETILLNIDTLEGKKFKVRENEEWQKDE